jgi:hypothetical protein
MMYNLGEENFIRDPRPSEVQGEEEMRATRWKRIPRGRIRHTLGWRRRLSILVGVFIRDPRPAEARKVERVTKWGYGEDERVVDHRALQKNFKLWRSAEPCGTVRNLTLKFFVEVVIVGSLVGSLYYTSSDVLRACFFIFTFKCLSQYSSPLLGLY